MWTVEEDQKLKSLATSLPQQWTIISDLIGTRDASACEARYNELVLQLRMKTLSFYNLIVLIKQREEENVVFLRHLRMHDKSEAMLRQLRMHDESETISS